MMLPINKFLARADNYGEHRNTDNIRYLVYHYTGNKTDTAWANCNYFATRFVDASAHYFVDEDNIYQSVPDDYVAWSVGSTGWLDQGSPYASKGHNFWKKCTNANSISIEMCSKGGVHTQKILKNAKELGKMLCNKYGITNDHVIRHFDVNGKLCPITFVVDSKGWESFKADIGTYVPKHITLDIDGLFGKLSTMKLQGMLGMAQDGWIGGQTDPCRPYLMNWTTVQYNDGYLGSATISRLQNWLVKNNCPTDVDGLCGKNTITALQKCLTAKGFDVKGIDGYFGINTAKAFQRYLNGI